MRRGRRFRHGRGAGVALPPTWPVGAVPNGTATGNAAWRHDGVLSVRALAVWAFVKRQPLSFWLICGYLFFEYVRPQSIYTAIDVLPWTQVTLIGCAIALLVEGKGFRFSGAVGATLVLYSIVVLLSSVTAYDPPTAFAKLFVYVSWVIIYFLIVNAVRDERQVLLFLLLFLLCNLKMSQHAVRSWAMDGFAFRNWGVVGAPGWFNNSGEFGVEMCVFLPISYYFYLGLRQWWSRGKRLFFLAVPGTAVVGAIGSSSRGALVGIAAVTLWMLLKSRYKVRTAVAVSVLATGAFFLVPPEQIERFTAAGEDETSVARIERWRDGIQIGQEHPLLGIGYANWAVYYPREYGASGASLPHNVFIEAFAELGYSGMAALLLLLFVGFRANAVTRRRVRALGARGAFLASMAHGLDGAFVGFLVSGMFVTVLYYPYLWINLAMTAVLSGAASHTLRSEGPVHGVDGRQAAAVPAPGAVVR